MAHHEYFISGNATFTHSFISHKSNLLHEGHFLTSSSNRAEKFLRNRCLKTSLRDFLFFPRIAIHTLHGKHCQHKMLILLLNCNENTFVNYSSYTTQKSKNMVNFQNSSYVYKLSVLNAVQIWGRLPYQHSSKHTE